MDEAWLVRPVRTELFQSSFAPGALVAPASVMEQARLYFVEIAHQSPHFLTPRAAYVLRDVVGPCDEAKEISQGTNPITSGHQPKNWLCRSSTPATAT